MARLLAEVATALLWLTRLPAARLNGAPTSLARAAWAFPVAGLLVGAIGAAALGLAGLAGLPAAAAALLAVAAMIWTTGALHEDGLADLADSAGGQTPARRLEIMRDSRIGSYGVLALVLVTGLRVVSVAALMTRDAQLAQAALIGIAAASRAGMVAALAWMEPARKDGLGRAAGRPSGRTVAAALALGGLALVLPALSLARPFPGWLVAAFVMLSAQFWLARKARRNLGGQTGDVLGAMQQASEVTGLLALLALT